MSQYENHFKKSAIRCPTKLDRSQNKLHFSKIFKLNKAGSEILGIPENTPLISGPYDLQACGFGAGATKEGQGTLVVGTTLSCQVLTKDLTIPSDSEPSGMWLCTPFTDLYLRVMPSMVGTASMDWLLKIR